MAIDNGVLSKWNFTAPEEEKWLHDREGGVVAQAASRGMHTGKVKWNTRRTYLRNLIDYLEPHFQQERFNKIQRYFYEIPAKEISNIPSPHKTLKGITSYFSFLTLKKHEIYYRKYPCKCTDCNELRWGQCRNQPICGFYYQHKFGPNIPYPVRVNKPQIQRPNNMSNVQHDNNCNNMRYTRNARDRFNLCRYSPHQ